MVIVAQKVKEFVLITEAADGGNGTVGADPPTRDMRVLSRFRERSVLAMLEKD